jgi:hypothetical protein
MNFVYLSPNFPPNFINFSLRLKDLGVNVLGIGEGPYEELTPPLKAALREYYRIGNMHNYDELVRALGYLTHRHGKLDRLDSHAEYWLETEARLRTDFNIPGIKADVITKMKSKSAMKEIFRKAGVAVAQGRAVNSLEEGEAFLAEVGTPLVAKPDIGVGAAGTFKIESVQELRRVFKEYPSHRYFLEEFISGKLYSFDGLVDGDGKLVFFTSHHFNQGIMETVNTDDHMFYYSLRDIPADLEDAGRRLIKAFHLRERFFHFEFFRTHKDGRLVALEVNMRPPGGLSTDMFNYANDIDIYKEWANVVVNNRFEASYTRPYHACYVGRKASKNYRHSTAQIHAQLGIRLVHHEAISGVFAAAIGNYGYIVRSPEEAVVLEDARYILELA